MSLDYLRFIVNVARASSPPSPGVAWASSPASPGVAGASSPASPGQDGLATISLATISLATISLATISLATIDPATIDSQTTPSWTSAAGTFDAWPEHLGELKVMDPCCGSGQFPVAAFQILVPMRMEREGLSAQQAVDAVLRDNLHGLELDQRCVDLAAFALALSIGPEEGFLKYPVALNQGKALYFIEPERGDDRAAAAVTP